MPARVDHETIHDGRHQVSPLEGLGASNRPRYSAISSTAELRVIAN
ncbi:MAG: hypothetical protein ACYDAG_17035 [Chloroflexota bacterium]